MLRQFFSYYKPYKKLFFLDFFSAIAGGLMELSFPLIVNYFIDTLLPGRDWRLIILTSAALFGVYALSSALQYVVTYWGHMLGINIETDMRKKLFDHLQKLSFKFYDNNKTGSLMSKLTNDLMYIGETAHHGPEDLFIAIMTILGAFGVMLFINWQLALLTFIIMPVVIWLALYFNKKMTSAFTKLNKDVGDFSARVENNIGGIRLVQAFSNEAFETQRFDVNNQRFRKTKLTSYKIMAKNGSISYMLTRFVTLFVLLCGTWFVIRGSLSYGEFVAFVLLTNVLFRPIDKINAIIELYPRGIAGFKSFIEIMETEPDIKDAPNARHVSGLKGNIRYDGVSFGYEENSPVLSGINLSIHAGETVAFVGPSGAGKSTLTSLLPRFYEPSEGVISIDGINIKDMTLSSLRGQIGVVQQDVFLFSGTLRENIAYGRLDASEEEIRQAVRQAHLEELVNGYPDGLNTVIGERGVKLSGGQKQRLSIARMFLKNPSILILDEATSALDTETEAAIQKSLQELSEGRTTLVIAHRLATIKDADRIVVVTKEGIAEQGHHKELLASGGIYQRLHQAQFGELIHE
ncbi:ABC transporter ATP-binding protein [Bacillus sp. 2211]|uniref:ABC transporter ATP-binding protein n=1 Tax=Bacillus TaxID=1386 RepID=UPI000E282AC5|nr:MULTISPECIES: ABC transporter ATP-binding protein [Bacillus]MBD0396631.1 ABC transporter ATP-binding protein [Bacillus sp. 2211]QVL39281.1 ABC transporter ATP-binding protein [Bacillus velezensis]WOH98929.1 ABC transporter ATP-binding protein [Bacillus amyloliquefaciens]WOI51318.1 ABC transporter ATP-binding protein [Bacillus amyloliquefaciens]WOI64274.1 ABC transporter ATP-binding protein [Bacillus amyloliquefaciens]